MLSFRVAGGVFTVRLWPTLLTAIMFVVLLGLGTWQVERLHWKENLIATIHARMQQTPVDAAAIVNFTDADYRPGKASGILYPDKEMHQIAISSAGLGGWSVLTPMRLDNGKWLLVNRGWVPYNRGQGSGFRGQEKSFYRPAGPATVTGILRLPHRGWMQPDNHPEKNEWYGIDLAAMAKFAGVSQFLPVILEADATPNPGGYPVGGQTRVNLPNNHFGYALTWYGLALALLVIYGISGFRKVS